MNPRAHVTVQRCMHPFLRGGAKPCVDRAEVDQIPMAHKIIRVTDHMLPMVPPPDAFLTPLDLTRTAIFGHRAATGKPGFQHGDPAGAGPFTGGQGAEHVKGCGQYSDSIDAKGMAVEGLPHRAAQQVDPAQQQVAVWVCKADRQEISDAREKGLPGV